MKNLNTVQKIILTLALFTFIISNIITFTIAIPSFKIVALRNLFSSKPVNVDTKNISKENINNYAYGEIITLNITNNKITFDNNKIISGDSSILKTNLNSVEVKEGLIYISTQSNLNINLGKGILTISPNVKCIYNYSNQSLILIDGSQYLSNNRVVTSGQVINWKVDNYYFEKFDLQNLRDNEYTRLLSSFNIFNEFPKNLEYIQN